MLKNNLRILILVILLQLQNNCGLHRGKATEKPEAARHAADGPYVFYRQGKVIVKSVLNKDSVFSPLTDSFSSKKDVRLSCYHEPLKEGFEFSLQDTLIVPPTEYAIPVKMLVVSDIEGNFGGFSSILKGAGVISKDYKWTFGEGHLMLVGDFFDRGQYVTETLWLIYKLEKEAEAAGGRVHFILGNHEMMNMYGNTNYVQPKYLINAVLMNEPYNNWYSRSSELGRWLRTKNVVERVGDILFLHGGVSPALVKSGMSLQEINKIARDNIGRSYNRPKSRKGTLIYDRKLGPFWYRGLVKQELTDKEISKILQYAKVRHIIVGHTLVNQITPFYKGKVIAIDLYHERNYAKNFMNALWIEKGEFFIIDDKGVKTLLLQN